LQLQCSSAHLWTRICPITTKWFLYDLRDFNKAVLSFYFFLRKNNEVHVAESINGLFLSPLRPVYVLFGNVIWRIATENYPKVSTVRCINPYYILVYINIEMDVWLYLMNCLRFFFNFAYLGSFSKTLKTISTLRHADT